jgi:class III poly(R)-hydroxyalkanoic acid synthase PhaE subunit
MTDAKWLDEWTRAWQSFPGAAGANPWTTAFDHFTKSNQTAYRQQFAEALTKISDQSRAFLDLGETLVRERGEDWQESVFQYLDTLAGHLEDPQAAGQALMGASTLDYWQKFAGHDPHPSGEAQSWLAQMDKLLQMPGVGYTREHQESLQELSRLWLAYERAYGEYAAYCGETARRSLKRLRERLADEFQQGPGPATIRALYDTWVACSEETYAERAATEEYMRLHGTMVNALMAYRRQAAKIMDQWAEAVNLPTRQEVDILHRKLKETRQELNALKSRLATGSDTVNKAGKPKSTGRAKAAGKSTRKTTAKGTGK